jgi:hypothetical protein
MGPDTACNATGVFILNAGVAAIMGFEYAIRYENPCANDTRADSELDDRHGRDDAIVLSILAFAVAIVWSAMAHAMQRGLGGWCRDGRRPPPLIAPASESVRREAPAVPRSVPFPTLGFALVYAGYLANVVYFAYRVKTRGADFCACSPYLVLFEVVRLWISVAALRTALVPSGDYEMSVAPFPLAAPPPEPAPTLPEIRIFVLVPDGGVSGGGALVRSDLATLGDSTTADVARTVVAAATAATGSDFLVDASAAGTIRFGAAMSDGTPLSIVPSHSTAATQNIARVEFS